MTIDYTTDLWMLTPEHLWELTRGVLSEIHNRITDTLDTESTIDLKQFENACGVIKDMKSDIGR